jgi:hypothetical protein
MIFLEKCDSRVRETCKPEEEIKRWMKGKYILLAHNQ